MPKLNQTLILAPTKFLCLVARCRPWTKHHVERKELLSFLVWPKCIPRSEYIHTSSHPHLLGRGWWGRRGGVNQLIMSNTYSITYFWSEKEWRHLHTILIVFFPLFFVLQRAFFYFLRTVSGCDSGNRTRNIAVYTWLFSPLSYGRHPLSYGRHPTKLRGNLHTSTAPLPMRYTTMGYTSTRYTSTALYFYEQFTQAPNKFFEKHLKLRPSPF